MVPCQIFYLFSALFWGYPRCNETSADPQIFKKTSADSSSMSNNENLPVFVDQTLSEQERDLVRQVLVEGKSAAKVARATVGTSTPVKARTLRDWVARHRKGLPARNKGGRPPLISAQIESEIVKRLFSRGQNAEAVQDSDFPEVMNSGVEETAVSRGEFSLGRSVLSRKHSL